MNVFQTIEHDLTLAWDWSVRETEGAAVAVWNAAKPLFVAVEAPALAALKGFIADFLGKAGLAGSLADLETALLNELQLAEASLLATAKALGSNLLQVLIGLVKAA